MDIEQMKKDLGGGNVFPIGEENVVFAKYFTGECYLNMLTTERVPVGLVTFAPGTIIHPYYFLCPIPIIMGCLMPFKHNLFLYHNAKQICCILADLLCIMI